MSQYLVTTCKNPTCLSLFRIEGEAVSILGKWGSEHRFPLEMRCPHCDSEMWVEFKDVAYDDHGERLLKGRPVEH
jgi:hypothetical protein